MRASILVCVLLLGALIPAGSMGEPLLCAEPDAATSLGCDGEWNRTYGGSDYERAAGVASAGDGYMLVGPTASYGPGPESAMAVRTDRQGNERWNRTYGSRDIDIPTGVVRAEGGYVVTGISNYTIGEALCEAWLFKIDGQGDMVWNSTYLRDPVNLIVPHHVEGTADGGYIVAGRSHNTSGDRSSHITPWLMKTDGGGEQRWTRFVTGLPNASASAVCQTQDGGYVTAVTNWEAHEPDTAVGWLIRTDDAGTVIWKQALGGGRDGFINCLQPTADGGFLAGGAISRSRDDMGYDLWLVKTDDTGHVEWEHRYGWSGGHLEDAEAILPVENGFLVAGARSHAREGGADSNGWLVRVNRQGEMLWSREAGGAGDDAFRALLQADAERYIAAGYSSSFSGSRDMWLASLRDPGMTLSLSGGLGVTCRVDNRREEPRQSLEWSLSLQGPYVPSYTLHGSIDRIPAGAVTDIRMLPVGFGPVEVEVTVGTASILGSFWMLGPLALEQ